MQIISPMGVRPWLLRRGASQLSLRLSLYATFHVLYGWSSAIYGTTGDFYRGTAPHCNQEGLDLIMDCTENSKPLNYIQDIWNSKNSSIHDVHRTFQCQMVVHLILHQHFHPNIIVWWLIHPMKMNPEHGKSMENPGEHLHIQGPLVEERLLRLVAGRAAALGASSLRCRARFTESW